MRTKIASLLAALTLAMVFDATIAPEQAWALICTFDAGTATNSGTDGGTNSNTVCGEDADASGTGSENVAIGSSATAVGTNSGNTATVAATSPPAGPPMPAAKPATTSQPAG